MQEWVKRSRKYAVTNFQTLRQLVDELDKHLTLRTHIVGHNISIADLAVWATIRNNNVALSYLTKTTNNISRWYGYIEATNPWISELVAAFFGRNSKDRTADSLALKYDLDILQIVGLMITRFLLELSGYLHVGHAKAALLNNYYAHLHPDGTLICRFDDTNPSKESMEFQDAILEDLQVIDIMPQKVSYSSDYFQVIYDFATKLILAGKAFADDSELGKGDEDRKNRLPSKRRDLSIEETLLHFAEMKAGSEEGRRWCLRAKIAYDSPNGTLRDPVIYRCNLTPHHRTGNQWNIYPTYDFCAPILDSVEGVTLALRTNEYRDRNAQYEWMQDALGLRKVAIWDFSRMNFVRTVLSKRKLTRIVKEERVTGWDDPRMPTIRGILRRGMTVTALRQFILEQGPSKNILNLEWGALWALNKKIIDPQAPRYTAVAKEHVVYCHINGLKAPFEALKPVHAKSRGLGVKKVLYGSTILIEQLDASTFEIDEEITLMNWGNAYIRTISRDEAESRVTAIEIELYLEGDVKKTKKKITWLAATETNMQPVELVDFDYLITKDKLEKEDELEQFLTPITEFRAEVFADCNVKELAKGTIMQFDRKGYYKLDVPYSDDGKMVFFKIPSGRG